MRKIGDPGAEVNRMKKAESEMILGIESGEKSAADPGPSLAQGPGRAREIEAEVVLERDIIQQTVRRALQVLPIVGIANIQKIKSVRFLIQLPAPVAVVPAVLMKKRNHRKRRTTKTMI
jgi:hypothetical protein